MALEQDETPNGENWNEKLCAVANLLNVTSYWNRKIYFFHREQINLRSPKPNNLNLVDDKQISWS